MAYGLARNAFNRYNVHCENACAYMACRVKSAVIPEHSKGMLYIVIALIAGGEYRALV